MVIDVTDQDFEAAVVERSRTLPVVVDFWASWCGPCRSLTPVLEQTANEREGKVVLAKLDTEANQATARAFDIRSIPAVKAFKDGRIVSEFVGGQPPARVAQFFDALVPSEAEELVAVGGEPELRRALELEPARAEAAVRSPACCSSAGSGPRPWRCSTAAWASPRRASPRGCASRRPTRPSPRRSPAWTPVRCRAGSTR